MSDKLFYFSNLFFGNLNLNFWSKKFKFAVFTFKMKKIDIRVIGLSDEKDTMMRLIKENSKR